MIFHYIGKYSGDESSLPQRTQKGAVPYQEVGNMKQLSRNMTIIAVIILVVADAFLCLRTGEFIYDAGYTAGMFLSFLTMFPHEFLHALWFPGDVYMYTALSRGMMFVTGTNDFSKARFIAMSLCPNVVFGLIPYVLFMFFPTMTWLAGMGSFCLAMGAGDYYNVINCVRQVPKGGMSFMSGMHTYWYVPKK